MVRVCICSLTGKNDLPLGYHQKDLVIYEMHLRGFTKHDSSNTKHPGTYIGAVSKLDHLKVLFEQTSYKAEKVFACICLDFAFLPSNAALYLLVHRHKHIFYFVLYILLN